MKKCSLFGRTLCASMALCGTACFVSTLLAQNTVKETVKETVDQAKDKMDQKTQEWNQGRIQTMLTQVTQSAVTGDGLENVVNCFNDADRTRIKTWIADKNNKAVVDRLNGRINQFRGDWKAKYGSDFDIKDNQAAWGGGNFMNLAMGEMGQEARLAGEKVPAGNDKNFGGDTNLNKGRNIAYLTIIAEHGQPSLKLPLIHEMPDNWKIDVPNGIDGATLCENLNQHLIALSDQKQHWPADANQAHRLVGRHVLMGCVGATSDKKSFTVEFGADEAKGGNTMDDVKKNSAGDK